jgi:expansin (peptidoglycan-binding protein)
VVTVPPTPQWVFEEASAKQSDYTVVGTRGDTYLMASVGALANATAVNAAAIALGGAYQASDVS